MKSRPILFSAPMVRAILAGRKTQTRRIIKGAERETWQAGQCGILDPGPIHWNIGGSAFKCPYGRKSDQLWVKETFMPMPHLNAKRFYRATDPLVGGKWTPSIFMPRAASRITLAIIDVRVERLQDITEADAIAEGVEPVGGGLYKCYQREPEFPEQMACLMATISYRQLWKSINGPASWDENPWVWAITFDPFLKSEI